MNKQEAHVCQHLGASLPPSASDHFDRLSRLLDLEAEAEREQATRTADENGEGRALTGMVVRDEDAGLGGRLLLTFGKRDVAVPLPPTRLQPGSPVLLKCPNDGDPFSIRGVVFARGPSTIRIVIDDPEDGLPEDQTWRIELSSDEVSRRRQKAAMERAKNAKGNRLAELREVLLGQRAPEFEAAIPIIPLDASLNESQRDATALALAAKDLAIIHGPPGTGKTTAVVEVIRQAIRRGERVLACAPSNLAVDNLLEKLLAAGENAVRLGHPARVAEPLRERTLDVLAESHPDARQARKFYKEAHALFRKAGRWTRAKPEPGERASLRREARSLIDDARQLDDRAVEKIIDGASVLCATLTGLNPEMLGDRVFDLVVIDEACQSPEPAGWIAIGRAKRVVLAGDHCQLPPTVLSLEASRRGLSVSLMDRLVAQFGPAVTRQLNVQYRMHEAIAGFSARVL